MSLSAEAIIAIVALFVALIQLLCTIWKRIVRRAMKIATGTSTPTLPLYVATNHPPTEPLVAGELRFQDDGRGMNFDVKF
ncbi:hypothetical protein N7467_006553 [Penicillium canescens]|nr:hypothetical protein N7467_006553 [Penicillium canescens]